MPITNITEICTSILNTPDNISNLKTVGEIFLGSYLLYWIGGTVLSFFIALFVLGKKDAWGKFFVIFIMPVVFGLFIFIFTYIIPIIPNSIGSWFSGMLSG